MVMKKLKNGWLIVRLETGEDVVGSIHKLVTEQKISSGWVSGIGGVTSALVGYYHRQRKKYVFRHVRDVIELVSLRGNISRIGGEPALHMHCVVTDRRNKAYGGHAKRLEVGATCEVLIQTFEDEIVREMNPEIGLPLLKL